MLLSGAGAVRARGLALLAALGVGAAALLATTDDAEARQRHRGKHHAGAHRAKPHGGQRVRHARGGGYSPPYAAFMVDASTGKVLHAENEDAPRHPASVTKVMTLYLLFEQVERGRLKLDSELRVSARAQAQAPSKLGVRAGDTIGVEEAIKALVTKSANDVAVVVAENVAGSEEAFAEAMTRKARQLGMSRTLYRNASGLPNPAQTTTARDLVTLGRAIQDRFPRQYAYFATPNFAYEGSVHRNHNRLLGRVEGVDGIKTGFTNASGFNLLTSARAGGRHVVAAVLGGRTARARDATMASLVEDHLPRAYAGGRTAAPIVEAKLDDGDEAPARAGAQRAEPARARPAVVAEVTRPRPVAEPTDLRPEPSRAGRAEVAPPPPARPSASSTPWVVAAPLGGATPTRREARPAPAEVADATVTTRAPSRGAQQAGLVPPGSLRYTNSLGARAVESEEAALAAQPVLAFAPAGPKDQGRLAALLPPTTTGAVARTGDAPAPARAPAAVPAAEVTRSGAETPASEAVPARKGWVIQLAAAENEEKARAILDDARAKGRGVLADAEPFTERVTKGSATLWRARFAGFDDARAEAACRALKGAGFSCFAQRL